MTDFRVDRWARTLAATRPRRAALQVLTGGALAGVLSRVGLKEVAARCVRIGRPCQRSDRCCLNGRCRNNVCRCPRPFPDCGRDCCPAGGSEGPFICCLDRFCCNPQTPNCCPRNSSANPPEQEHHCCFPGNVCCSAQGGRGCCPAENPGCCPADAYPNGACCPAANPVCCAPNATFPNGFCCPSGSGCCAAGCCASGWVTATAAEPTAFPEPPEASSSATTPSVPGSG